MFKLAAIFDYAVDQTSGPEKYCILYGIVWTWVWNEMLVSDHVYTLYTPLNYVLRNGVALE